MPRRIDDRWLWLGFGVFVFFAAEGIRYAITDIVQLTKIDSVQQERKNSCEHEEDKIPLKSLRVLSEHPNPNLANAAMNIVVSRFRRSIETRQAVHNDLYSKNTTVRKRAEKIVHFLSEYPEGYEFERTPIAHPRRGSAGSVTPDFNIGTIRERLPNGDWVEAGVLIPSAEDPIAGWTNVPRERPPTGTAAADARRRREAMVLHEGDGPVEEADIIRPNGFEH